MIFAVLGAVVAWCWVLAGARGGAFPPNVTSIADAGNTFGGAGRFMPALV